MRKPLTRSDLDNMPCQAPNCGTGPHASHGKPMRLVGRCHPTTGSRVTYSTGTVRVFCHKCSQLIAEIEVAP